MTASQPGTFAMIRFAVAAALLTIMFGAPSFAVTSKEKMATCKFGADDQKLAGAAESNAEAVRVSQKTDAPAK